jgi:membrane protein YqaA with SNARE-associated domain
MSSIGVLLSSCFGLSILSGFVPWISAELVVVSCAALLSSPASLTALALTATSGQAVGGSLVYWFGLRAGTTKLAGTGRLARWRARLDGGGTRALALVFLSSASSIPPLYLTTIAAGTAGMRFSRFLGAAWCGLFVRFAVLAFLPGLAFRLVR